MSARTCSVASTSRAIHTYDWGPADALPTGDPRLDQNPFFKDHLEGAVEKELATRGFDRPIGHAGPADSLSREHQ